MSREDGRFGCTREEKALRGQLHAALPMLTTDSPSYLWQLGPRRGGAAM